MAGSSSSNQHSIIHESNLPSERRPVVAIISICHDEPHEDMPIWLVLLHIHRVVPLRKDGSIVIGVLNLDVDEDTGGEDGGASVDGLHLEDWGTILVRGRTGGAMGVGLIHLIPAPPT